MSSNDPLALATTIDKLKATVAKLNADAELAAIRHQMAQAFTGMQIKAYAALLNYGINHQELPAYKDPDGLLDKARTFPLRQGQELYFEYMRRVEHEIAAAIRRKSFSLVVH
ncbi:hypothetical protein [Methylobacterium marchantiae]|uniref:Uncharacterized protein n=1 Tax=Methylobacterium marchantiae TaxID=600331 RepID=A0ABW3X353_9HYPH|nr:hypothetical protein AIGOOFII_3513 [Methylobacterium marchantiae]